MLRRRDGVGPLASCVWPSGGIPETTSATDRRGRHPGHKAPSTVLPRGWRRWERGTIDRLDAQELRAVRPAQFLEAFAIFGTPGHTSQVRHDDGVNLPGRHSRLDGRQHRPIGRAPRSKFHDAVHHGTVEQVGEDRLQLPRSRLVWMIALIALVNEQARLERLMMTHRLRSLGQRTLPVGQEARFRNWLPVAGRLGTPQPPSATGAQDRTSSGCEDISGVGRRLSQGERPLKSRDLRRVRPSGGVSPRAA